MTTWTWYFGAFLLLATLAGCFGSDPESAIPKSSSSSTMTKPGPCSSGYFVGCDTNSDAHRMVSEFGLRQMTNASGKIVGPKIDAGLVTWMNAGYHGYDLPQMSEKQFAYPPGRIPNLPQPSGCCILYSLTPYFENEKGVQNDFENSTVWIWDFLESTQQEVLLPKGGFSTYGGGFDGEWAVLLENAEGQRNGITAVNVRTGASTVLFEIGPKDNTIFGTPQVGNTLSNGSAFLNFLSYTGSGQVNSRIVEYDLDARTETNRFLLNNSALTRIDSSPRYLIASGYDGDRFVWVMDRGNHTWWNIQRNAQAVAVNPAVGGNWAVYYEQVPTGSNWVGGLVGIHLPTGTRHELVPDTDDVAFAEWDTDGQYFVAEVELGFATGNAAFPGTQLYWMELPGTV